MTQSDFAQLAKYLESTLLKPDITTHQVATLCRQAKTYAFAGVCLPTYFVEKAKRLLQDSEVSVITVVGFPLGCQFTQTKTHATGLAIQQGAQEIDMVMNIAALKDKELTKVEQDVQAVVAAAEGHPVKVIIETAVLSNDEKIEASKIAQQAGAHYVKTSTGFAGGGATVKDIELIRSVVGANMGIKASGGIRDAIAAEKMIQAGANRIGTSSAAAIITGETSFGNY